MRRVVTGTNTQGQSTVVSDGIPPFLVRFPDQSDPHTVAAERVTEIPSPLGEGEGVLAELWSTGDTQVIGDPTEGFSGWNVECLPGHTRFRTSLFSPNRTTAMHETSTIDYDFVLEGTVDLLLSDGSEIALLQGDAIVIPGVAHAWRAGPAGCRLGVVMIGAQPSS